MTASPSRSLRSLFVDGPAGRLEALLDVPEKPLAGAAVICHPHPLHGGTMHNKVVYRAARGSVDAGLATLRFNFRGVGASQGAHSGGAGEQDDLRAALAAMEERFSGVPLMVGGFSFGSVVALKVGVGTPGVSALVGIGLPLLYARFDFLSAASRPILILHGEKDPFGSAADIRSLAATLGEQVSLEIVPGVGHFFDEQVDQVRESVRRFCTMALGPAPAAGER